jgi:hypothetical protein
MIMIMKKLALFFLLISSQLTNAQNLLTFSFEGRFVNGVGVPNFIPSNFNAPQISSSTISRTSLGISPFGGEAMNCNGISVGTTSPVLTSYIEFRVTPQSGKQVSITGMQLAQIRSNGTGATRIAVRSNLDGFTSNLGGEINFANTDGNISMLANLSFNLTNINSQIIFRIYPYGGLQTFGTWGLGGRAGDDVVVFGTASDIVLPINLVRFSADKHSEKAKISWTTASEFNNDKFLLEKSIDGKKYDYVAELSGAGNSKELNTYEVIDNEPHKGNSYYRLTQTDFDGQTHSFEPIVLSIEPGVLSMEQVAGSGEQMTFSVYSSSNSQASFYVYDMTGQTVHTIKLNLTEGYQTLSLNTNNVNSGMYIIQLSTGKEVVRKRVLMEKAY